MGWYIIGLIIALIIQACIADKFSSIAMEKGYTGRPYFWLCFLLGVVGYCMVAALPDLVLYNKISNLDRTTIDVASTVECATPPKAVFSNASHSGTWRCTCGRVNANYVSTCSCGNTKRSEKIKQTAVSATPVESAAANDMWACKECGTQNSKSYGQCKKCGTYRS